MDVEFMPLHSESVQNELTFINAAVANWVTAAVCEHAYGHVNRDKNRSMARRSADDLQQDAPDQDDLVAVFGANLKAARLKQGLTQGQLAERAGLLQQYVSLVETGRQNVTLTTAQALAKVVHQDVSEMLRGASPKRRRK